MLSCLSAPISLVPESPPAPGGYGARRMLNELGGRYATSATALSHDG